VGRIVGVGAWCLEGKGKGKHHGVVGKSKAKSNGWWLEKSKAKVKHHGIGWVVGKSMVVIRFIEQ
jgi:hypothetical protein